MVFSSIPLYLDPFNWQQQQQGGGNHETSHLQPSVQPTQVLGSVGGGTATSIMPNSTAERARLAKITQPEAPLKCPRCESTNTKFCYFNNYSLSQPRHFCRTCRRYWTRGGTLRNVPVGGGCRRNNKRSKNDRLKPPVTATTPTADRKQQEGLAASSSTAGSSIIELIGGHFLQPTPQLSFVDSFQHLTQLGVGKSGSNFEGMIQPEVPNFSMMDYIQPCINRYMKGYLNSQ
ncbi:hypothetical protein Nepgr_013042 [Nepenthes gracilis]|uniref:Dof zinc finger protein n=1 Tax=Nepenthes gracilis TaxID=150966 RepID=A0AAD3SIM6_NEPGR|nr:hypothetical protein Nepgr_013042 [Nepenthes gracilis]